MSPTARRTLAGLGGAAAMIAAVTVLSRVLGFGRYLVQAHAFDDGSIGGVYNAANTLPNVLFEVAAGGALAGALIPVLALPVSRALRKDVDAITSATFGWTLLVLVPLGAGLAAASGLIASVWPNLDDAERGLLQYFIAIFAVQVPMYGIAVLLYAVLQAHKRFFWPAFAPVLSSVVVIATYLVYAALAGGEVDDPAAVTDTALAVLGWGTTLGVAAMCFPMFIPVHRLGVRIRPTLRFPPGGVGRRLAVLAFAGVGSLVAQQLSVLVALLVAGARGSAGTWSVYLWSQQVYLLPYAVLVVPLATSTFPRLAQRAASGEHEAFARMASGTLRAVLAAAALGAAVLVAIAPAVTDIFDWIADGGSALGAMTTTITWLAPGLLGFALMFHASRALYALERGRSAIAANVVGWGTVAVAAPVLAAVLAPAGDDPAATLLALAQASSLGMLTGGALAVILLRRAAGRPATAGLVRAAVVLVAGAAVGALAGRWVVDAVAEVAGHGPVTAAGAAAGGAVIAAFVVAGAVLAGDRGTVRDFRAIEAQPRPPAAVAVTDPANPGAPLV
ncbi:murein biosynthesis integral membrane protein MurJ [Cellulomonas sp. Leaf395]|uniref:murein biosynthesis integral membrane protein MurJ n=1 Tax=Cellulomonas sp. Leaf395 TaxID=1736362 RepID=UPI0006F80292|nr:lipid II flippase MurJ [Cellulomonas sp. Leaf395]KQS97622.1 virulence factor MviN [Cellulomonas sp. Leaf395]